MKKRTLKEHIRWIKTRFAMRLGFYRERGLEVSPTAHTLLYQNRRYMVSTVPNAMRALNEASDESPLINQWRATSAKNSEISKTIQKVLVDNISASLAQLVFACERQGSRESVRRVVAHGVELGLLAREGDQYQISDLYVSELFDRYLMKIRHPYVVKLGMFTSSVNVVENIIQNADEMNTDPDHPLASKKTLTEAVAAGDYDDEIDD